MKSFDEDQFLFLPLGGVGEIGMNLALYGYGTEEEREWIIVDVGVSFAGLETPGADLILPDISFIEKEKHNIKAIILTHAHEDHYGALLDLWPAIEAPVYCSAFTAHLLEAKRERDHKNVKLPIKTFKAGDKLKLEPFTIKVIQVNHSIPEAASLAIETPLGTAIHTGDWKIDKNPSLGDLTDQKAFKALGKNGVLALICDSTNASRKSSDFSECDVEKSLRKIILNEEGRVAITTFSSNIGRIRSIALAAQEAGRKVLCVGRSMERTVGVAEELGYLKDVAPFLSMDEYVSTPRDKIVIILTGSQGEQRAALTKLSRQEMRQFYLSQGDCVVYSSRDIPGNERAIIDTQNRLIDLGIKVITDYDQLVHVSGHPGQDELKEMYQWTKPKILIPVHGEPFHLSQHTDFAEKLGLQVLKNVRNGRLVKLAPGVPEIIDEVPVGYLYKDGKLIGREAELGIAERKKLSFVGHICLNLLIDKKLYLVRDPQIVTLGLPQHDLEGDKIEDILMDIVEETFDNLSKEKKRDNNSIKEACTRAIRSEIFSIWGKKPVVTCFVNRTAYN